MSVSNYFDKFVHDRQVIPTLSNKYTVWVNGSTLIITIKWLHHYGNIVMIPVKFRVDVNIKRTQNNKGG
jgi:hypothetical protein